MSDKLLIRLINLFREDQELHDSLLELLNVRIESERALIEYRKSRTKVVKKP